MSFGLHGVREAARKDSQLRFTALLHHVNEDCLREAFFNLKKTAAVGVDGVTWHDYEQDFLGFSYGFRPGRSQHDALDALSVAITSKRVNWILDADVEGFFDTIDHEWLIKFLEHRIGDRRILRLIRKWLTAGVYEDGKRFKTPVGTPQGSVISPLLANVYLHYVFDLWIAWWRKQRQGDVVIIRYADDFVLGFERLDDAEACLKELPVRFAKFGLKLHESKTRLIEFGKYADERRARRGEGRPETFDFLGFTLKSVLGLERPAGLPFIATR